MADSKILVWDEIGEHLYETGVRKVALYPFNSTSKAYDSGVAWNGVTAISENPSGAESTKLYANDGVYLNLTSIEEFGCSIEAYTYPDEFAECDGSKELVTGVKVGQQPRKVFGLCYRTALGNDVDGTEHGYKLHLVYGCLAAPSEKAYSTINDSPDAITFSWEISTTPVAVGEGFNPTSVLTIDSTAVAKEKLAALEAILYGSEDTAAKLPLPAEVLQTLQA